MIFRTATRQDLPAVLALLAQSADTDPAAAAAGAPEPASGPVSEAHELAFAAIEADPRNEMLVLEEDGVLLGCLQLTYVPGLGQGGRERALVEAVRIRADRRGGGSGPA